MKKATMLAVILGLLGTVFAPIAASAASPTWAHGGHTITTGVNYGRPRY